MAGNLALCRRVYHQLRLASAGLFCYLKRVDFDPLKCYLKDEGKDIAKEGVGGDARYAKIYG